MDGSPKARWENRCEGTEKPLLLDPIKKADVQLIDVMDDGRMDPSPTCIGTAVTRVERSVELYGLNLPRLKGARLKVMRDVIELPSVLFKMIEAAAPATDVADCLPIQQQIESIKAKTFPNSAYSKAARATLMRLPWGAALCAQPEEMPDPT